MPCAQGEKALVTQGYAHSTEELFSASVCVCRCYMWRRIRIQARAGSLRLPVCACVYFIMHLLQCSSQTYLGLKDKERSKTYGVCWHMGAELWILSQAQELNRSDKENKQKKRLQGGGPFSSPPRHHHPLTPLLPCSFPAEKSLQGQEHTLLPSSRWRVQHISYIHVCLVQAIFS